MFCKNIPDFSTFKLISKMPFNPKFNELRFVNIVYRALSVPPQKGLYFNHQIGCADDMIFFGSVELNRNAPELKATGLNNRLRQAIIQSSANPISENAKYIIFVHNAFKMKHGNEVLWVFENVHENVYQNLVLKYELFTTDNE